MSDRTAWNSTLRPGKPLARKKGLDARKAWLKRKTRLNPINRKRRQELFERNFGPKRHWIAAQPCEVTGVKPPGHIIEAAHMKARGMGGCGGDMTELVPLWTPVHRSFDEDSEQRFFNEWGRTKESVRATAADYHARWLATTDEVPEQAA